MSLTVSERQHWKERIAARINKRIDSIKMAQKDVFDGLKQEARARAVTALGISELERERTLAKEELRKAEKAEKLLTRKTIALIRGVEVSEVSDGYHGSLDAEITAAIRKREEFEFEQLIGTVAEGAKVAELLRERENLLDTVWLATSPAQVKELWQKLGTVLGDEETALQKEALSIAPAS